MPTTINTPSASRGFLSTLLALSVVFTFPLSALADVVTDWNVIALKTFPQSVLGPSQARCLGIVHAAIYDAVNSIDRHYSPYKYEVKAALGASLEAAVAQAARDTLVGLFPDKQAAVDAAIADSLKSIPDGQSKSDGIEVGKEVAKKALADRLSDGADAKIPYTPGTTPSSWQPTPPNYLPPLLVQWGKIKPFMLKSPDQISVPEPLSVTSAEYAKDIDEVRSLGAADSTRRSADQTAIAIFWTTTTSTPWNEVARDAAKEHNNSLVDNARLFALLNMITSDSQVACWYFKYKYNFLRPVTAIHNASNLGNPGIKADQNWEPLIWTPAHPDYPAGHCAFSASAARVLQDFFKTDKVKADVVYPAIFGMTRHWRSFSQISEETNNARVWGGIHTRYAAVKAADLGRQVADYCMAEYLQPIK